MMPSRATLGISARSKSKNNKLRYLWYSLAVLFIAVVVTDFLPAWGQPPNKLNGLQQSQQLATPATCSDTLVGTTEVAPQGALEHLSGSAVDANGLEVTVQSINYNSSGSGLVNVHFKVIDKSTPLTTSNLYDNTGLIGSDGNYYNACLAGTAGCPYDVNSLAIQLGQTHTTCVTYLLPADVMVSEVEYLPLSDISNGYTSNPVLWMVAPKQNSTMFVGSF